jgi:hypothetical protein
MRIITSTLFLVCWLALARLGAPMQVVFAEPRAASPANWSVQLDDATLTQQLNAWMAGQGVVQTPLGMAQLEDMTAELRDNQLVVHGSVETAGMRAPVDVALSAAVDGGGRVQVQIDGGHLDGVPLPAAALQQVGQLLQTQIDQSVAAYGVDVTSIHVGDGTLVVTGTQS